MFQTGLRPVIWCALLLCTLLPLQAQASEPTPTNGEVVLGNARFTIITPECIRLEFSPTGSFINEPSYFAANRQARFNGAKVVGNSTGLTIDTGEIKLTYKPDGKPFGETNLHAVIGKGGGKTADWHPGSPNPGNLGGTVQTLDNWEGARELGTGLLSRDGWYLLDDSKTPLFTTDWAKGRPATAGTDWYLFGYGLDFKGALKSLTTVSGPVPMPRRYTLGAWYSRYWPYSSSDYRDIVHEYSEHEFPLDVLVLDMDWHLDGWTGYTWNPKLLKDHAELLKWLHEQGIAVTLNDHPANGVGIQEKCYNDFMAAMGKDPVKDPPLPFDAGDKKYLDTFYAFTHKPLEKEGVDFWWLDWQQDAYTRSINTLTNLAWLNYYNYQDTSQGGMRGVSFSRWAGWGSQRYPISFSGDASTAFKMLEFEVPFTSTSGNVGCFFWSHDIGGHTHGRNEESYARWCQFGALSAALRSHSTRAEDMDRRPWKYPSWAEESMQVSFQLRSKLFPYIYSAVQQACADSVPFIRPMYLDYPTTETAYHQPQQFMFGDNLLVAPITEPGIGTNRLGRQSLWFPPGTWFNYFTNERFGGDHSGGEQQALVAADIDEFPLYFRGGVPVPMRSFTQRMATDPLTELLVRCYPGADGQSASSTLYEDDGLTTAYRSGDSARTKLTYSRAGQQMTVTIAPTDGSYNGQVEQRSCVLEFPALKPASRAMIDGVAVPADYVAKQSMVRVKVPARSIRKGCTVAIFATEVAPEKFTLAAFADRASLDSVPNDPSLLDLLPKALLHSRNEQRNAAICAAAGIGVFPRNLNVYGWPDQTTEQTFTSPMVNAIVKPIPQSPDSVVAGKSDDFTVTVSGHTFLASAQTTVKDWTTDPLNIAPAAKISVSSGGPGKGLVDGRIAGYPQASEAEWATQGESEGAWVNFEWPAPQTIDRVVLFDRPNMSDNVTSGKIEFSDGSSAVFGSLENDASRGTLVKFEPKTVTSLRITITGVSPQTVNPGFSEVVIRKVK
jgi:alpha-glucosidase (family GH31 glycosyl hydrolase)